MALDLLGLGVSMLRCLAGSAVGFMVSKGIRSAASESGGSIRTFLQKDIDHIREKLDSLSQSKLSAALQNVRQGLILLDQQFSISGPMSCSPSTSELESAVGLCVTTRTVLAADSTMEIPAEVRRQFELAQQLAIESFHDKRNVPAMLRVESLKLQLFCSMLIHYQQPERWLGLWTVILEESMKDKELAAAAASACEISGSPGSSTKLALAVFWRKSNTDLSQAMSQLVENLHCALMAALWHPNVDARVAFGRSRILQYPRLLLCRPSTTQGSQQPTALMVNLEAPFLYPWRADRVVVVLPSVFKLISLFPTNKLLTAQYRTLAATHSNAASSTTFSLKILDTLTLTEDETLQLEAGERLLDVDFDRTAFNLLVLSSTTRDGLVLKTYNLQFENVCKMKLEFSSPCSQVVSDPVTGSVITFNGTSVDDEVYVLKSPAKGDSDGTAANWFSYENIFKCMLADRPGSIRVSYAKPFRQSLGDEANFETGLELMLYNRFTDIVYSLVTSFGADEDMTVSMCTDGAPSSTTSTMSTDEENMTKIQQIYPLKTPLLKVRVFDDGKSATEVQKVMLEKGAIFEHDQLAGAKEKCLVSAIPDDLAKKSPREERGPQAKSDAVLMGALVSNDESSALHVFEVLNDHDGGCENPSMRFKTGEQLELPLYCEQWEDRYLGGIVCFGKFVFVGTLMCKVKICDP